MSELAIGMIGLGVMGRNLALNIEEKGFSVAAYDAWPEPVDRFVTASQGKQIKGFHEVADLGEGFLAPRRSLSAKVEFSQNHQGDVNGGNFSEPRT